MKKLYSNLPLEMVSNNQNSTVHAYNSYFAATPEIDANIQAAMTGFFEKRGFDATAAASISVIVIKQALLDNYSPMQILDTLKGLGSVEISALVSEILNFNRLNTSFLGYAVTFSSNPEITRNIVA